MGSYRCMVGETEYFCYEGRDNLYCVITYFLHHMKSHDRSKVEKWAPWLAEGPLLFLHGARPY